MQHDYDMTEGAAAAVRRAHGAAGGGQICSAQLLYGLLHEKDCRAGRILAELGVTQKAIEEVAAEIHARGELEER